MILLSLMYNTGMQKIIIHFLENTEQHYPGNFAKVELSPLSLTFILQDYSNISQSPKHTSVLTFTLQLFPEDPLSQKAASFPDS